MAKRIIVLSGPVASGKSTLANALVERHGMSLIKTRQLIHVMDGSIPPERAAMQQAGELFDRRTKGRWVADALTRALGDLPEDAVVLIDSVRVISQVDHLRSAFGTRVIHVHLTAPFAELAYRYQKRHGELAELESYDAVRTNKTEAAVDELRHVADVVVDTHRSLAEMSSHVLPHNLVCTAAPTSGWSMC